MGAGSDFLERFRKADREGDLLGVLADDPAGFGAALDGEAEAFETAIANAVAGQHGALLMLNDDCFASAACGSDGEVIVAGAGFDAWFEGADPFNAAVRNIEGNGPRVSLFADERNGRPVAIAAAKPAIARHWPLDLRVRDALASGSARFAVVAFRPGDLSWTHAAQAYGFTRAEALLVAALARHGDLQRAAVERGIAYETARKFVAAAMHKTGAKRQTELIRQTLILAAGEVPFADHLELIIRDLFSLTERQANLALLVAQGATRDRAAQIVGVSEHRAKADLKTVFQACGVSNAVDLSRIVTEINALKGLAIACDVTVNHRSDASEPLRLIPRTWAEGRIAVADHGPRTGKPVVVFHSNVSGRHHSRSFVAALRNQGYRPIMIERAGYGLSDSLPGDPVENAVCDFHDVLDALDLQTVPVIARCTTASAVACAAERHGRISGAILVRPHAPARADRDRSAMTDVAIGLFAERPRLAVNFGRMLARRTSAAMIQKLWRASAKGVTRDEAVLDDAHEMADIVRGAQQAALGLHGFLNETLALRDGANPRHVADASRWTLIVGRGYQIADADDAAEFWGARLPGATIEVIEDGVHFLHVTHVENVIAALTRMDPATEGRRV